MTSGYDPAALAVALFLTPGFHRVVREGLFYLQGTRLKKEPQVSRCVPCVLVWLGLRVYCARVFGLFAGSPGVVAGVFCCLGGNECVVGEEVRHRGHHHSRRKKMRSPKLRL